MKNFNILVGLALCIITVGVFSQWTMLGNAARYQRAENGELTRAVEKLEDIITSKAEHIPPGTFGNLPLRKESVAWVHGEFPLYTSGNAMAKALGHVARNEPSELERMRLEGDILQPGAGTPVMITQLARFESSMLGWFPIVEVQIQGRKNHYVGSPQAFVTTKPVEP